MYHDCKSYIEAVAADTTQVNPLLQDCQQNIKFYNRHDTYLKKGTFLNTILGLLGEAAKQFAQRQRRRFGWVQGL